jgi:hypothetical protein
MSFALEPLVLTGLTSNVRADGAKVVVELTGSADMESVDLLNLHLAALHRETLRAKAVEVAVDFRQLEFMSSSCLKAFVEWISNIQDLAPGERYRVEFRSNPQLRWQRRSLHSLQCFAADLITVVES